MYVNEADLKYLMSQGTCVRRIGGKGIKVLVSYIL